MQPGSDHRWEPFHEPLSATVARNGAISLIAGAALAPRFGGLASWPIATLLALWPSFGGHWVELWFLNWLRPRLPFSRAWQAGARVGVWFIAGIGLGLGMRLTAFALAGFRRGHWPGWWMKGLAFIALELAVHLVLQLRGRPGFFNGRG